MLEITNELGDIRFSRNVILRIVDDAVETCDGRVTVHNFKGKYKSVMPGHDGVTYLETPDGVDITVYVVVNFGTSIRENCGRISAYINENVERVMGERPHNVRIVVTGVQSKEIARRNIVFNSNPELNRDQE
ncbi:MAG: Asp23/Gls24 family envelope stress response protein [Bacillota bacterium]|nr:Asp23/Gls24 family envelope stress response protein [Bacillota bacterium]